VVVLAQITADRFRYLVLGDSTLAIDQGKPRIDIITDRRIDDVAAAAYQTALRTSTPEHQAARARFVRRQRELRNQPGGYWIASSDPEAARYAVTSSVPAAGVRRAALLSDGVTRFAEFGLGTWDELLAILGTRGPAKVFFRIRAAEEADPDGAQWPRAKRHDDMSAVLFTRQDSDTLGEPLTRAAAGKAGGEARCG